ncbi:MAG: InlB B-repeat-containing protein [Bacillota bacterium]
MMVKFLKIISLFTLSLVLLSCNDSNLSSSITIEDSATLEETTLDNTTTNQNNSYISTTNDSTTEVSTTETHTTNEITNDETTNEVTTNEVTTTEESTTQETTTEESTTEESTTEETTTISPTTITFNSNGGSNVNPFEEIPGTFIDPPANPIREGYDFSGWYSDQSLTNLYIFSEMPEEDITVYAKWEEIITPNDILTEILIEYDFVCTVNECSYEVATGYTYIYNLNDKLFIYEKITSESESGGYRYLTNTITIDTNWDVVFYYDLDENYGHEIITQLELSGNAITNNYSVDDFYSNTHDETSRRDKAIEDIGYFVAFINSILSSAELTMDDL